MKKDQPYFKCATLTECTGINHGFFSKNIAGSRHIYSRLAAWKLAGTECADIVIESSRVSLAQVAPFSVKNIALNAQIHSAVVKTIGRGENFQEESRADALVTRQKNICLTVLTADCAPVLFADEQNQIIGAAHAGWKGALAGILPKTVDAMLALGAKKEHIRAVIGPCIRPANYEVDSEFRQKFIECSTLNAQYFEKFNEDKFLFNLPAFVGDELRKLAIKSVVDLELDTFSNPDTFFSYRRSTKLGHALEGNLISIISLK